MKKLLLYDSWNVNPSLYSLYINLGINCQDWLFFSGTCGINYFRFRGINYSIFSLSGITLFSMQLIRLLNYYCRLLCKLLRPVAWVVAWLWRLCLPLPTVPVSTEFYTLALPHDRPSGIYTPYSGVMLEICFLGFTFKGSHDTFPFTSLSCLFTPPFSGS